MGRLRQNRPFLTEAGRFAGRLRHLWQSASDIRAVISVIYGTPPTSVCGWPPTSVCGRLPTYVQLASDTRAGRLCHLQDISVTCGGLGPLPPGHLFIGLTAGIALFRFLTGIFRFFRFLNR